MSDCLKQKIYNESELHIVNKSVELIKNSDQNITEIVLNCDFNDSNCFSRVFEKHRKTSPVQFTKESQKTNCKVEKVWQQNYIV